MESIRDAMTEVGLFVYVLEKEVKFFQRTSFPVTLQVDSLSPCVCFIPLERAEATTFLACAGIRDTLALRCPANDVEASYKAVRVFFLVQRLREVWMRATQTMVSSGWLPTDTRVRLYS